MRHVLRPLWMLIYQPVTGNTVPAMSNGQQVGTYELDPILAK